MKVESRPPTSLSSQPKRLALGLFSSVLWLAVFQLCAAADAPRPNILYFYVDDMGWGSIGPNGQWERKANGLPYVRTPNIDALARAGVNFRRGYACTVCSPSRSSQQTGFHQGHTFADRNDPDNAKKAMRADDILIGDVLSAAGYVTGYWGKWGYGGSKDQLNPTIDNVQTLPTAHGYQHVLAELHHVRAHTFFQPTLWKAPANPDAVGGLQLAPNSLAAHQNNGRYPNEPALQNHPEYPAIAYCDDSYAMAALDFVRAQSQKYNQSGEPFFGLLAVQIPHAPFGEISSLPEWDRVYSQDPAFQSLADQTKQWAAMVSRIDAHFGNILGALDDPNGDGDTSDSVAKNTLVIFQSDNGGPRGKNNVELNANGGLRGNKGSIQEGGIRVPLVMRWPEKITKNSKLVAGTNSDLVVDITDLLPTFCDLAGVRSPLGVDGVSIAPILMGQPQKRRRDFIIHESGKAQSIIRGRHKLVRQKRSSPELYDLKSDHAEANNIAADHPQLVAELESLLLGERVDEPKGFATTYHRWTGASNSAMSDADNWSDYEYSNAGVSYLKDAGAPKLSWIAQIENQGERRNVARCDADAEFLALEIHGNERGTQSLDVFPGVTLLGRNEIRIGHGGAVALKDAKIETLRWLEIETGGQLSGSGTIDGSLLHRGTLKIGAPDASRLNVTGDYFADQQSVCLFTLGATLTPLRVSGVAELGGTLKITHDLQLQLDPGTVFSILTANNVEGRFSNENDLVVSPSGTRFTIQYSETSVSLLAQ